MSASDSELAAMEDSHVVDEERDNLPVTPVSAPSTIVPPSSSSPSFMDSLGLNFFSDSILESKAISMASNDCSYDISSPAEASPAKPAQTPPSIFVKTFDQSPDASRTTSASDFQKCSEMSIVNIQESPSWSSSFPPTTFGNPEMGDHCPPTLTFKGVSVSLENNGIWMQFHQLGTEMILCKQGRRMFPYCRYRLSGLDPDRRYRLVLSIVPSDQFKYRWGTSKWEISGKSEHQSQSLSRAFSHHYGSCRGSEWMSSLVSFYKLKLSNNFQDQDGHVMLYSMHRYIPRLHVIPLPEEDSPSLNQCLAVGTESITFTFPQTEFMAVTTYQNFRITQLKINHNPFAKGFREDGNNPRLHRIPSPVVKTDPQSEVVVSAELCEINQETLDQSTTDQSASAPSPVVQETKLVLKPIMSNCSGTGDQFVPCLRGKHSLGELVLVEQPPEESSITGTPHIHQGLRKLSSSSTSTPRYIRKRRKVKKRWGMYNRPRVPRVWKVAASSPTVAPSPLLSVAMQPELDNIEGLLFVSFSTKEALEVHVGDMPTSVPLFESPVSSPRPMEPNETVEVNPETAEEKISQLESVLLIDLSTFRHGQIIHPVLQEVGMKLSSLDPDVPVDLKYLGVCLPPAPPSLLEQSSSSAPSLADEGLPFISRTGKTSDMTKIKGWKNKFIRSQETSSPNCDRTQKNLSAFCSNMLDEYLESEAQQISERAAAFSTSSEGSVSYQLPIRGSSYVKTLDSVLRHQNAASSAPAMANRPCPLSRKPRVYASLRPSAAPPSNPEPLSPAEGHSSSSFTDPDAASGSGYPTEVLQTLLTSHPAAVQRLVMRLGHKALMEKKLSNISKMRLKLQEMEARAVHQGLSRTLLTPERLTMALTVLLTKETLAHQILQVPSMPKLEAGPECGEEFCRLGCVCSSLQLTDRGPIHCRKPECMFGCTCSETSPQMEQTVRPHQSSSANKLWNRNIFDNDPEPLSVPKSAPSSPPLKVLKRNQLHLAPPMREEDKDPVYRYLESKMTCARVREFCSKTLPPVTLDTDIAAAISKLDTTPQSSAQNPPEQKDSSETMDQKAEEKPQPGKPFNETEAKKQIQINSLCQWKKDRRMVLDGLYSRLKQNQLHKQFFVGPYLISPVAKIVLQKPSGAIVTFRVQINKLSKVSDCEEDESDEEDDYVSDGNAEAEEDEPPEEPEKLYGVTPFLRGVVPAGELKAKRKPPLFRGSGLIQVNGKHYSYARLLLGNMGSLHPANRVAAHITGRLRSETFQKKQAGPNPMNAGNLFFPVNPPVKGPTPAAPRAQIVPTIQLLIPVQQNLQDIPVSSPVSLTVSQSLKCPSFLAKSGTYSFRICPPSNQAGGGQNPVGVALPGGFTLIELPKPAANGAVQQVRPPNAPAASNAGDASTQKRETASNPNPQSSKLATSSSTTTSSSSTTSSTTVTTCSTTITSSSTTSSSKLIPEENPPSAEISSNNQTQEESNLDITSEELSSDLSDYEEMEDDEEPVDIETVEEKHSEIIAAMREYALNQLQQTRDATGSESSKEPGSLKKVKTGRKKHQELEKLRRGEERLLFQKLQITLGCDVRAPRDCLLSAAVKEVAQLQATSKQLDLMKEQMTQQQSAYVKKLSLMSGKSEAMIYNKLKEISERQKRLESNMKFKPVFSQLLQSKAALLQATTSMEHHQALRSNHSSSYASPPLQTQLSKAAQDNVCALLHMLHPTKISQKGSGPTIGNASRQQILLEQKVTPLTPKMNQPGETSDQTSQLPSTSDESQEASGDPDKAKDASDNAVPQGSAAENQPASESSNNPNVKALLPNPAASLPLVRSKTGRIILPSSLRPIGQGFYTLVMMEPKKKQEEDQVGSSDRDLSTNSDQSSDLNDLAVLNPSDFRSPPELQATEDPCVNTPSIPARLCFNTFRRPPPSPPSPPPPGSLEPDPRSKPSPKQSSSTYLLGEEVEVEEFKMGNSNIKLPQLYVPSQSIEAGGVKDAPAPVKRGRGRPRKNPLPSLLKPPAKRAAKGSSASKVDSAIRFSISSLKSSNSTEGDIYVSRPLTRASLGKDFPSAKKRSWIDVEKELEPDLEYV